LAWKAIKTGNDGEILFTPPALETGHGDAGERSGRGKFDIGLFRHGEADLDILEHIFQGKTGLEIGRQHAGKLEVDHAGAGSVVFECDGQFVEFHTMAVEESERFGKGGDGARGDEIRCDLHGGGLPDASDGEDLPGRGFQERTRTLKRLCVTANVVNKVSCRPQHPGCP
jgi:hypothetical protein